jgi:arylsulfatase A-like enzyme
VKPKNVIVLHTDQQRYDSLGCMGNGYARTPNLDRLAAEGTLFTRHIVSNPVCMPSRASLMTGLYPPGHNVWTNGIPLNRKEYADANWASGSWAIDVVPEPPTLADMFSGAGYDTVSFGKLHLTPYLAPLSYGFPEAQEAWSDDTLDDWHGSYYGFRYVDLTVGHGEGVYQTGHYNVWLERQHPDVIEQLAQSRTSRFLPVPTLRDLYALPIPSELHYSTWLAERLCDYLEKDRPPGKPFFAFVGFPDPHHPFAPCYDVVAQFEDQDIKEPYDPTGDGLKGSPALNNGGMDVAHLTLEERRTIVRYTYAMVLQIDTAVGRIVDMLKARGLWDDTIVIFTSDHGDFLGDHARLRKGIVGSDALLHVPFILHAPGTDLPNQADVAMSNCDVMPTLAALTGIEPPAWQHGKDIGSVIKEGAEHYALAFCANGNPEHTNFTVYDATHRLTYYPHADYVEFFDHRKDPGECANVAAREENKDRIAALMQVLQERLPQYHNPIVGRVGLW